MKNDVEKLLRSLYKGDPDCEAVVQRYQNKVKKDIAAMPERLKKDEEYRLQYRNFLTNEKGWSEQAAESHIKEKID